MSGDEIAIVMATFFFAAFMKGITGLGFSTTCLPILAATIGLKATLPLLIVPSLASNVIVMRDAGHFRETVRRFWPLLVAAVPGIVAGLALLTWIPQAQAAAVLGVALIAYGVFALRTPHLALPAAWERTLAWPTGLLTGTLNGLTGSQMMPVLPYLLALRLDPNRFIQAINCSFTFSSLVMAAGLSRIGLLTWQKGLVSALGLVLVYAGIKLGGQVRRRMSVGGFRLAVLWMLIVFGVVLAGKPLLP